jgi:hypothetical protein
MWLPVRTGFHTGNLSRAGGDRIKELKMLLRSPSIGTASRLKDATTETAN